MSPPVALVTGGSSGIGLALTQHLLSLSFYVITLDINPPPTALENTLFIRTDVSSWDQLSSAFSTAFSQHKRLDFVALNAGIDDRDDIFASLSLDPFKPPRKPNMLTFDVNLFAPYYGVKLAAHYMSLNTPHPGGKIVITASSAGLYSLAPIPQYTASKHALVGLTRSLAPVARAAGITVNAIAPAIVATGLAPPGLMDAFGDEVVTPMSTIMRAFEELGDLRGEVGGEGWIATGHTGQIVECSLRNLYFRDEVDKADDSQKYMAKGEFGLFFLIFFPPFFFVNGVADFYFAGALDAWSKAYTERNRKFALQA